MNEKSLEAATVTALPPDLEALSVSRFDELVAKGELIYEESTSETIEDHGFKVGVSPARA